MPLQGGDLAGVSSTKARPSVSKPIQAVVPEPVAAKGLWQSIDDVPSNFTYIDFHEINAAGYEDVAALIHAEGKRVLLINPKSASSPKTFELVSRLRQLNWEYRRQPSSQELVKMLHDSYQHKATEAQEALTRSDLEHMAAEIIEDGLARRASDVHIEVRHSGFSSIFYRIYGHRVLAKNITFNTGYALASIFYDVMADNSSKAVKWQDDKPLDTVINYTARSGQQIQIRFASAPIYPSGSFQIVMRLLVMDTQAAIDLPKIGYTDAQRAAIDEMLVGSQGLVLLVGPTNSGKSTSMQAMTKRIMDMRGPSIKVETIEDPVEYLIPGAAQMPVGINASFNHLLKSTLRHDPDVLGVGEIRDHESAEAVKNIVLAGRKVLATLHVYEALAAFSRLHEIGVPQDVLYMKGFVSGIIYQRLLPRLCECSIPWDQALDENLLDPGLVERVQRTLVVADHNISVRNPVGCPACKDHFPGYKGRTVCAEIVQPDERMLDALRRGNQEEVRNLWLGRNDLNTGFGVSALSHALLLMSQGAVDPRDVESQVAIIRQQQAPSASTHHTAPVLPTASRRTSDEGNLLSVLYERD